MAQNTIHWYVTIQSYFATENSMYVDLTIQNQQNDKRIKNQLISKLQISALRISFFSPSGRVLTCLDSSSTLFNVLKLKGHEWDKLRPAWDQLKYNFESCLPFLVKLFSVARSVFWIWWKIFDRISLFLVGFEANLGFCQEQSLHPKLVPAHMWTCKPQWLRSVENIAKGTTDLRAKSTLQIR